MTQLELLIITRVNSVYRPLLVHSFESPKLIGPSMARVLYDRIFMLEISGFDVNIHFIEETFDDIDFACFVDIPSLVVPVIRLIYY